MEKRLDDFRKELDAANSRAQQAEEEVKKMLDQRENERYIAKTRSLVLPGVNPDDFAPILRKMESSLDESEVAKLDAVLKGASELITNSALLNEVGFAGRPETSVDAEVEDLAKKFMQEDPALDAASARAKVWLTRNDLYRKYREEKPLTPVSED